MQNNRRDNHCKICGGANLSIFAHTAKCKDCEVLLYYPYPEKSQLVEYPNQGSSYDWYSKAANSNYNIFRNAIDFTVIDEDRNTAISILDFGGGGGQFAISCKFFMPKCKVYIVDVSDIALLDEWRSMNHQIKFADFEEDNTKFDYIFLNDVFEHLPDPLGTLKALEEKLAAGGRVFINTPKQFWIYPISKLFSKTIYKKVLRGTVSEAHLQIWSFNAFRKIIHESGLEITKYEEAYEMTMDPDYYLKNMGFDNRVIKSVARSLFQLLKIFIRNKIFCVLKIASNPVDYE